MKYERQKKRKTRDEIGTKETKIDKRSQEKFKDRKNIRKQRKEYQVTN